jgi:Flp pilus assembly protein protease CpaA
MTLVFLLLAVLAATSDARLGRIPRLATWPAATLGVLVGGVPSVFAGLFCALLLPTLLYKRGHVGGGDVALLGALGALCPIGGTLVVCACGAHAITQTRVTTRLGPTALLWSVVWTASLGAFT